MKTLTRIIVASLALAALVAPASLSIPASAQAYPAYGYPTYTTWQPGWDADRYDRQHVMLGVVTGFSPYRLTVQRRNGVVQTVDLKNGTIIYPTGATPSPGERVALVGRYSYGTFVAKRVILRS
ncbi:MAG: hypothetical protein WB615_16460 [Candidatus Tumulicola sp.]